MSQSECVRDDDPRYWKDPADPVDQTVVNEFHRMFYPGRCANFWMGHEIIKNPLDLWIYQELIYTTRPDLIIECGTGLGGSALYMAHLCDIQNHGTIITIDGGRFIGFPQHSRISYLTGDSKSPEMVDAVSTLTKGFRRIMVILDSDHHKDHVLAELRAYSQFVTPQQYLIVEDSNINGHPVRRDYGPGPHEAIEEFLAGTDDFVPDKLCERFLVTYNPSGYLRRTK